MPNWTHNSWLITPTEQEGSVAQMDRLIDAMPEGGDRFIEALFPMPDEFRPTGEIGKQDYYVPKINGDTWHEWQTKNWGVKWGDCETTMEVVDRGQGLRSIHLNFDTPWDMPRPIIAQLATEYPALRFEIEGLFEHDGYHEGERLVLETGAGVVETSHFENPDCHCYDCDPASYE